MSRTIPSNTLEAAVRMHFGLTQAELGRYLGVSERQVGNLEAGRRQASPAANRRLEQLARLLPPPDSTGPAAPVFAALTLPAREFTAELPDFGPLPDKPLRKRQRQVMAQAHGIRWALHRDGKREVLQARRQWALTVLQGALPAVGGSAEEQAHDARWLLVLAADITAAIPPPAAEAKRALLVVRLLALEAGAGLLARLLAANCA